MLDSSEVRRDGACLASRASHSCPLVMATPFAASHVTQISSYGLYRLEFIVFRHTAKRKQFFCLVRPCCTIYTGRVTAVLHIILRLCLAVLMPALPPGVLNLSIPIRRESNML